MNFLQKIILDNTIASYLEVTAAILIGLLIKRFISKYLNRILYNLGKGQWSGLSQQAFDEKLIVPMQRFFMILVILISVDRLTFPHQMEFTLFGVSSLMILESVAAGLFIIGFFGLLIRFMDFIMLVISRQSHLDSNNEKQFIVFFKDFFRAALIIFEVVLVLKFAFHFNVSNLLTGLSLVGAGLAFAARESLENLIASFIIFFDKPFQTGDLVKVQNTLGKIQKIGLRSTRIKTGENSMAIVPNKQMVDSIVNNMSNGNVIRHEVQMNIPAKYSSDKIETIIHQMKQSVESYEPVKASIVFVKEINGDNVVAEVAYFTLITLDIVSANQLRQKITLRLKSILEEQEKGH